MTDAEPGWIDDAARIAHRLADAAAAEIAPRFRRNIPVEQKADITPVTEADRAAERAIRAILATERPDDGIAGEEYGVAAGRSGFTWVIDPIDGTKAFMTGRATFATLIALLDGDTPVLGVIDQPILRDRWVGMTGRRTTLNGVEIRTRACPDVASAIFSTTDPNLFPAADADAYRRISAAAGIRTYGGDGFAYGLLAAGWIDIVLESGLKLHDFAALAPVVEGAGGVITDWSGDRLRRGSDGRVLAAGAAALHSDLRRRIG
jgi:histidinol phosphatase-like enzyme (inositol monophosphatase family)